MWGGADETQQMNGAIRLQAGKSEESKAGKAGGDWGCTDSEDQ